MLESVLRDHLFDHPELLFDIPPTARRKEFCVEGKFVDLLFEVDDTTYIVELKRSTISREAVGQVMEYYGRLRRCNPAKRYRMILVAPSIPPFRSIPLEEFGIRCVEIAMPEHPSLSPVDIEVLQKKTRTIIHRSSLPEFTSDTTRHPLRFELLLPPSSRESFGLAACAMQDSIAGIQHDFASYEVLPIRMGSPTPMDFLCLTELNGPTRAGIWWAFAFGDSNQIAKNDKANISVNAYPWGLDFAINAEIKASQEATLRSVSNAPERFDILASAHGRLELQLWHKIEHQARGYHWHLINRYSPGAWNAELLLSCHSQACKAYRGFKDDFLAKIESEHDWISDKQFQIMKTRNKNPNIAIRLVETVASQDALWSATYGEQIAAFQTRYTALKPLIDFFR